MRSSGRPYQKLRNKSRPYAKSKASKGSLSYSLTPDADTLMVREDAAPYMSDTEQICNHSYSYGDLIRDLRISSGFTQSYVAENLGVTPGYISKVENDRTTLSLRLLKKYAELTGVSIDSIVGQLDQDYKGTALDNALITRIAELSEEDKERLLNIIAAVFD